MQCRECADPATTMGLCRRCYARGQAVRSRRAKGVQPRKFRDDAPRRSFTCERCGIPEELAPGERPRALCTDCRDVLSPQERKVWARRVQRA